MVPLYVWDNSTNSGKYADNSVQACYATWYHKFNSSCHTHTESWYMWEKGVPNVNGFRTQYSERLMGWVGSARPANNNGTKKSQLVFASDVIFHF